MNFTPKIMAGFVVSGFLTIAGVGLIGRVGPVAPAAAPIVATQDVSARQESFQTSDPVRIVPAVEIAPAPRLQPIRPEYYQPISSWYKSKHWWKRNAPIVGGAGGGAFVGALAGGGKGAIIGGAVGGGGGYLYKRLKHHNHRYYH